MPFRLPGCILEEMEFYRATFLDPKFVPTIGMTEETIREYIEAHKKEKRQLDQMNLFEEGHHL